MEARCPQALDPMLGTPNRWLALAPVPKSRASTAHDLACMQSEDLSAPAAMAADELQEDTARTHAKADDADLGPDWRAVVFLNRHSNTRHVGRQSA
jgi:hypothetical protein